MKYLNFKINNLVGLHWPGYNFTGHQQFVRVDMCEFLLRNCFGYKSIKQYQQINHPPRSIPWFLNTRFQIKHHQTNKTSLINAGLAIPAYPSKSSDHEKTMQQQIYASCSSTRINKKKPKIRTCVTQAGTHWKNPKNIPEVPKYLRFLHLTQVHTK